MNEQLTFAENGNISPCPYKDKCSSYGLTIEQEGRIIPCGCQGNSYWCKRYEGK